MASPSAIEGAAIFLGIAMTCAINIIPGYQGQQVEFTVGQGQRGPRAQDVVVTV